MESKVKMLSQIPLDAFKASNNVKSFDIFQSKATGKRYIVTPDGKCLMFHKDLDMQKTVYAITVQNPEGEVWSFIGNTTRETVGTL